MSKRLIYFALGFFVAVKFLEMDIILKHDIAALCSVGYFRGCVESRVEDMGKSYGVNYGVCGKRALGVYIQMMIGGNALFAPIDV